MNDYITLANSNDSLVKRFKAIDLSNPLERQDGWSQALDGSIDKSAGAIVESWQYNLTVPYVVADSNYGTMAELRQFFSFNDPNGTPNDVITLTDHFGTEHEVFFFGKLSPQNLTTILDGVNSRWIVAVAFREKV